MYKEVLIELKKRLEQLMAEANRNSSLNREDYNYGRYCAYKHTLQLLELYLIKQALDVDFNMTLVNKASAEADILLEQVRALPDKLDK